MLLLGHECRIAEQLVLVAGQAVMCGQPCLFFSVELGHLVMGAVLKARITK